MATLENGLNWFTVPYGKAFVRVVQDIPKVVESDCWFPEDLMLTYVKAAFNVDMVFGVTKERPRLPLQLFRRATMTVERIEAKTIIYEVLQTMAA